MGIDGQDRKEKAESDGFGFWAGLELKTVYCLFLTYFISFLCGFSATFVVRIPKTKKIEPPAARRRRMAAYA